MPRRMGIPDARVGPGMSDCPLWPLWLHSMAWLDDHSGAVTAMVSAVYAFFTVLLWRATKRQTMLTQRTVEASNRPYLSMLAQEDEAIGRDSLSFTVLIENVGSVPAVVTKWEVSATLMDLDGKPERVEQFEGRKVSETLLGACLFPGRECPVSVEFRYPGIWRTRLPLRLAATLEYRGPSENIYRTTVELERTPTEVRQRTTAT
jgi:hypothetical protein